MKIKNPPTLKKHIVEQWESNSNNDDVNVVEATQIVRTVARWTGICMFDMVILPNGRIQVKKNSFFAIICYFSYIFLYAWCTYYSTFYRQSIVLGVIYDSILGYYGEHIRSVLSALFVFYVNIHSFGVKGRVACWEENLKVDNRLREMGVRLDFSKSKRYLNMFVFGHIFVTISLSALYYFMLLYWKASMPLCKIFQVMYTISLTMHCLTTYCYGAYMMRDRHRCLNNVLTSIVKADRGQVVVVLSVKPAALERVSSDSSNIKEIAAIDNIIEVRKIYAQLVIMCKTNMSKYGMISVLIICASFISIILHIFYIMEATARGLTEDYKKYSFFVGYNVQQIFLAFVSIYAIVFASEKVYAETSRTPALVHDIINQKISREVTKEASLLSMQLLHWQYKYTAKGLFEIDYSFLLSVVGSITTYLIILLQFATNANMDFKDNQVPTNQTYNSI